MMPLKPDAGSNRTGTHVLFLFYGRREMRVFDCRERQLLMERYSSTVNSYGEAVKVLAVRHGAKLRVAHQAARRADKVCESAKQEVLAHQEAHRCGPPQLICEVRDRLVEQFQAADTAHQQAVARLMNEGDARELPTLRHEVDDAFRECEVCRAALLEHELQHGCAK
jgi:hypothetical protein